MPKADVSKIAACAGLAAFLYQFESCMVATALPVMSREITGLSGVISLVPAAYLVAAAVAIVPAGRLAMRVGYSRILAAALAILAAGTVVCWLATDATTILIGRGIQGLGGGTMASSAYGMVAVGVPGDERRGVLGWLSLGAGLGMVAGAPFGGLVAEWFSWPAVFALQIPLFAAAALVMLRAGFDGRTDGRASTCLGRSALLGLGIACLCVAGSLGQERGWLSPEILGLQAAAVGVFGVFFVLERQADGALFPAEIWAAKAFWPGWTYLLVAAAALGGAFFLVPFYLSERAGYSVAEAAGWMMILVAGYSLAAMGAGRLQKRISSERQALLGSLVALTGAVLFAMRFVASAGAPGVVVGCALLGVGFGLMFPAVNAACVARLPEGQRGFGAALLPLGINLGSVVGVIVCAELREWHLAERQADAQAFFAIVAALAVAGAGFWWQGRGRRTV